MSMPCVRLASPRSGPSGSAGRTASCAPSSADGRRQNGAPVLAFGPNGPSALAPIPGIRWRHVMETPLTPLEFARRTRRLHGSREAVVDGDLRLSYEEFFDRCDRWSSALQGLGIGRDDRVATIAPNTHAQLESFYAIPQIGAVLVPVNYRLTPEDFVYIVNHSGASVLCVDREYLDAVDSVRDQMPGVA